MNRKILLMGLIALSLAAVGPATAQSYDYDSQELPTNGTATPTPAGNQTYEAYIDGNTRIVEADYNSQEGTATVVIESDQAQSITVSDGGALASGESGTIATTTRVVEDGERQSITVPVTKADGLVAVTISTRETLYGYIYSPPSESVFEKTNSRDGWIGGSTAAIAMFTLSAYRVKNSTDSEPNEVE
jgi:hypothetical protein